MWREGGAGGGGGRRERGTRRSKEASCHPARSSQGTRYPSWGPTAGPFWKPSRDLVYFCSLTIQQKQRCDLSLTQRELCAPGSSVPAPTPSLNSRQEQGQQVAPAVRVSSSQDKEARVGASNLTWDIIPGRFCQPTPVLLVSGTTCPRLPGLSQAFPVPLMLCPKWGHFSFSGGALCLILRPERREVAR